MKRVMFAGTASSSGKTTISCGFMKALAERGMRVASFKCGPDYIDPMFHEQIVGTRAGNLDGFFLADDALNRRLKEAAADSDIAVLEGVMGYFDGIGFTEEASSYAIAAATDTPVVLVVNARGMAASLTALVRGYLEQEEKPLICGVILNQMPAQIYPAAKAALERLRPGFTCFGYVPVNRELELKSRHLGLVTPDEVRNMKEKTELAARQIEKTVDVDAILAAARESRADSTAEAAMIAPGIRTAREAREGAPDAAVGAQQAPDAPALRIAVAKDRAFSFLYRDNLAWLERQGARPVFFSPLEDDGLPEGIDGLMLSGGYPELYLEQLEKNESMRRSVRSVVEAGLPTIAECGGFLYLLEQVDGHALAGVLPGTARNAHGLRHFGYIYLTAREDGLLAARGETIRSHEFHHYEAEIEGTAFHAQKASGSAGWDTGYHTTTLYAGFAHIYFPGNEEAGRRFLAACGKQTATKK